MLDFKLQLSFWRHTDTAKAPRVQIPKDRSELRLSKQFVQICGGRVLGQKIECAVCFDDLRRAEECAPCSERETRADRDATHTEVGEFGICKLMIEPRDEDVDRFRRDRFHNL